jgi:hypothetical protein
MVFIQVFPVIRCITVAGRTHDKEAEYYRKYARQTSTLRSTGKKKRGLKARAETTKGRMEELKLHSS